MNDHSMPDGSHSQLGHCLKAARQARGLTLKQVAERTGLALSTLSKVENGLMSLTYDKLQQLTGGLKMEIAELFNPATGAWTDSGVLKIGRTAHTATLLPSGKVLLAGGQSSGG